MLYSPAERPCVCVCALTLRALFSFYSGLLCVCILLGVFCAIIRRGREQGNAALFIHTAVNSDAASATFTCSVRLPGSKQRAHFYPRILWKGWLSLSLHSPLLEFGPGERGTVDIKWIREGSKGQPWEMSGQCLCTVVLLL